jgi:RsmE family RNA methyltransferase
MPRPKAWKRLLSQLAQFDVDRVVVINAARVAKPYFSTQYLESAHYVPLLREGLMQAGRTGLPRITIEPLFRPFAEDRLDAWLGPSRRFLLDPAAPRSLGAALRTVAPSDRIALAIGPDTGFVPFEREVLVARAFESVSLGSATLRTDTAAIAALGACTAFAQDGPS